uniref:uncharacterized protein LOC122585013 n=1 Tax=Erigeron canadensis TaxID=72917 RepID=UPI001CB9A856|nr:uncharacterized protein LOC122585013 [Erigeron canadensis]
MAMPIGFTRLVFLVGAGYTTSVLLNNGKLSDVLRELPGLFEKNQGEGADGDYVDAVSRQVSRLAMEVRQLASGNQITVVNGGSSASVSSVVVPAAAAGAVGYGYMRWKGLSFSDLMYVTKENMENAVASLKSNLDNVSEAIAGAKKHLIQRIENLHDKVNDQQNRAKRIQDDVNDTLNNVAQIEDNVDSLTEKLSGLTGRMLTLEEKHDLANQGVWYLCDQLDRNRIPAIAHVERLNLPGESSGRFLLSGGMLTHEGMRENADELHPMNSNTTNGAPENRRFRPERTSRLLTRRNTLNLII